MKAVMTNIRADQPAKIGLKVTGPMTYDRYTLIHKEQRALL